MIPPPQQSLAFLGSDGVLRYEPRTIKANGSPTWSATRFAVEAGSDQPLSCGRTVGPRCSLKRTQAAKACSHWLGCQCTHWTCSPQIDDFVAARRVGSVPRCRALFFCGSLASLAARIGSLLTQAKARTYYLIHVKTMQKLPRAKIENEDDYYDWSGPIVCGPISWNSWNIPFIGGYGAGRNGAV